MYNENSNRRTVLFSDLRIQVGFPDRRQPVQDALSCHVGHHQKVDWTTAGLGADLPAARAILRRPHTRLTAAPELLFSLRATPETKTAVPIDNLIDLCYYE